MPNRKTINTKTCQHLGDGIWYDPDSDLFYMYDKNMDIYIEIESDIERPKDEE